MALFFILLQFHADLSWLLWWRPAALPRWKTRCFRGHTFIFSQLVNLNVKCLHIYWETILKTSFHSYLGQSTSVTRKSFSRDPSMPSLCLTCLIEDLGLPSELLKDLGLWSKLAMSCLGPHTSNDGDKGKVSNQGKGPEEVDLLWSKSEEQCVNKCDQVKCSKNCCHLKRNHNESCVNN